MKISAISFNNFKIQNLNQNQKNKQQNPNLLTSPIADTVSFRGYGADEFNLALEEGEIKKAKELYESPWGKRDIEGTLKQQKQTQAWQYQDLKIPFNSEQFADIGLFDARNENIHVGSMYLDRRQYYIRNLTDSILAANKKTKENVAKRLNFFIKENPNMITKGDVWAMYLNESFLNSLIDYAKAEPQKVFAHLSSSYYEHNSKGDKVGSAEFALDNIELTPKRIKFFEKLMEINPQYTMQLISKLSQENRAKLNLNPDESPISDEAQSILLRANLKGDTKEINEDLIEQAKDNPKAVFEAFSAINKETGDYEINSLTANKKVNFSPILYFMLLSDSNEFFAFANKTNFFFNALQNQDQQYLDLMERCLLVDFNKTCEVLTKPNLDFENSTITTPLTKAVDNKGINYSEFLKALYQQNKQAAFGIFSQQVPDKDGNKTNFLTYYAQQKGHLAQDFISYLTNFDLLFVNQLLSRETLTHLEDLTYQEMMENLEKARKEIMEDVDNKLSESEKRIMSQLLFLETRFNRFAKRTYNTLNLHNATMHSLFAMADMAFHSSDCVNIGVSDGFASFANQTWKLLGHDENMYHTADMARPAMPKGIGGY